MFCHKCGLRSDHGWRERGEVQPLQHGSPGVNIAREMTWRAKGHFLRPTSWFSFFSKWQLKTYKRIKEGVTPKLKK